MGGKVRVAIVDDSVFFRTFLRNRLTAAGGFEVVGLFADPVEAMERAPSANPEVLLVDMEMPRMRGNEFLSAFLPANPGIKALVVSSQSGNVFDAMQAGAIDFVGKPNSEPGYTNADFEEDLFDKIRIAASVGERSRSAEAPMPSAPRAAPAVRLGDRRLGPVTDKAVIAIGASTGGTEAILNVLKRLPKSIPGIVIVQHMPPGFTQKFSERLDRECEIAVSEARHMDRVGRGMALIAPGGLRQMRLVAGGGGYSVELEEGPKVSGHCPSVDVLFESVSKAAGKDAFGVILTGMGADGAKSLKAMRDAGAYTFGQDEASCVVYGMPKAAYDMGAVAERLPLDMIG
ncbi:MAG: chemotaxis-specific protein-glutamate methyltransferase CheB, partial [Oscillospiraceae bacterium]|nr:chemotaxis-specific protein-glutamate methyltransferase CheB [Oscillospiraceae bacterium]